jgi:hypothetical protein
MVRVPLFLGFVAGALLVVSPLNGQAPAPSPAAASSASSASSDPAPGPEFHGLRLGSTRARVEEILSAKHLDFREDAMDRLRLAGSPDPDLLPAPEVSTVVFDRGDRLVIIDFRWPLRAEAPNPFDQLLRGLSGRFGAAKRTGDRDYLWTLKDTKNVAIHLYENLRTLPGGSRAAETALQYFVSGKRVIAQDIDRLD